MLQTRRARVALSNRVCRNESYRAVPPRQRRCSTEEMRGKIRIAVRALMHGLEPG